MSNNRLIIKISSELQYHTSFTGDYKNKQQMLWICHDGQNNLYKFGMSNYNGPTQVIIPQSPSFFNTKIMKIFHDGYMKKIGFIDRFIDINSLEHHRIMLEKRRNGSYFT